jgi:hypothetical protein
VFNVVVVSTIKPKPELYVTVSPAPVIVTVEFPTVPFAILISPLPFDV